MLKPESALIPFAASALPAGPWLVFAPHADDETFGMGGSLVRARDAGIAVHVVVVTDGALGGDGDDLVMTRQREINAVAERLRLADVTFWSLPDRGVRCDEASVAQALSVIRRVEPGAVFFPGPLELHPDHRNVALLVWAALQRARGEGNRPAALAYEIGVQNPANRLVDISACQPEKEALMAIYVSQNSQNDYPDLTTALNKARTFTLPPEVEYAEAFYEYSQAQLGEPLAAVTRHVIAEYFASEAEN